MKDLGNQEALAAEQTLAPETASTAHQCCKRIYDRGYWDTRGHACGKKAKVKREGNWYCGIHDPVVRREKQSARDAERHAMFNEEMKRARVKHAAEDMLAALITVSIWCEAFPQSLNSVDLEQVNRAIAKAIGAA